VKTETSDHRRWDGIDSLATETYDSSMLTDRMIRRGGRTEPQNGSPRPLDASPS